VKTACRARDFHGSSCSCHEDFHRPAKSISDANPFQVNKSIDRRAIWSAKQSASYPLIAQQTGVDNFSGRAYFGAVDG
jgi:hypothetical protein